MASSVHDLIATGALYRHLLCNNGDHTDLQSLRQAQRHVVHTTHGKPWYQVQTLVMAVSYNDTQAEMAVRL